MDQNRHSNGKQKTISYLCGIFNLKSIDHHAWHDDVNADDRERLAAFRIDQSTFYHYKPAGHHQKKYDDLLQ
jgi:hypothetical protein